MYLLSGSGPERCGWPTQTSVAEWFGDRNASRSRLRNAMGAIAAFQRAGANPRVMALVEPDERTAASAYTNTARSVVRPLGPVLAGAAQSVALGLSFLLAGAIKSTYDPVALVPHRRPSGRTRPARPNR